MGKNGGRMEKSGGDWGFEGRETGVIFREQTGQNSANQDWLFRMGRRTAMEKWAKCSAPSSS